MADDTNERDTTGTPERDTSTDVSDADVARGREASERKRGESGTEPSEAREAGDSRPESPTAPASAGEAHGSEGVVDTGRDGPDIRPTDSEAGSAGETGEGTGETPVPSGSGGADTGQEVRTGSSAAAAKSAGSTGPHDDPDVEAMEPEARDEKGRGGREAVGSEGRAGRPRDEDED